MNEYLTNEELATLDTLLYQKGIRVDEINSTGPRSPAEPINNKSLLVLEQEGRVRLSDATRRLEERRLAKLERKRLALRKRKKYTRKRGTVHPLRKAAAERRKRAKQWATNPLMCILYRNRYKCKRIDQDSWSKYVNPLWVKYDPRKLSVEFPSSAGTRADPWTVYNMKVIHEELGVVYNGYDQLLYDLSDPARSGSDANGEDQLIYDLSESKVNS